MDETSVYPSAMRCLAITQEALRGIRMNHWKNKVVDICHSFFFLSVSEKPRVQEQATKGRD
jgi:hypothetical protein